MKLKNAISKFYFDMTINELRLMNSNISYPNITYNSLLYLDIITYKEKCTVSFLADALNVSKSAVTLKINELIKQGFVIKTKSTDDKRINYLTVKQEVIDETKIYDTMLYKAINSIEKDYSSQEVELFCDMLQLISKCFSEEYRNE